MRFLLALCTLAIVLQAIDPGINTSELPIGRCLVSGKDVTHEVADLGRRLLPGHAGRGAPAPEPSGMHLAPKHAPGAAGAPKGVSAKPPPIVEQLLAPSPFRSDLAPVVLHELHGTPTGS